MSNTARGIWKILIAVALILAGGLLTLVVWNWVLVPVAAAVALGYIPTIGFVTAVGINILWGLVAANLRQVGAGG